MLLFILILLQSSGFAAPPIEGPSLILDHSDPTSIGSDVFQIFLGMQGSCTSTLIEGDWLITAAHCVLDQKLNQITPTVSSSSVNLLAFPERETESVKVHPKYLELQKAHALKNTDEVCKECLPFDVALINLKKSDKVRTKPFLHIISDQNAPTNRKESR